MKRKLLWAGMAACSIAFFLAGQALFKAYPDLLRLRTMDGFASRAGRALEAAPAQADPALSDLKHRLGKPDGDDPNFGGAHALEYQCVDGFVLIVVWDPLHPSDSQVFEVKGGVIRDGVPAGVRIVHRARIAWESAIAAVLLLLGLGMIYVAVFRGRRRGMPSVVGNV